MDAEKMTPPTILSEEPLGFLSSGGDLSQATISHWGRFACKPLPLSDDPCRRSTNLPDRVS